ncbi:PIN domain-containing protein [uncultured Ralstonia sp.]|jgi:predicted nucleic acid-binding protein|uniref:PIN domain-containing protein n=1 Tax=Ralstonia sp. TaxID=54061 RepID=UPI001EA46A6C|nr:PIN domain-containing protein [uncultured Ralstonia sp.]UCF24922.1 MAG: PIN domain-containing protein [Ralstonia sp.]
MTVAEAFLDSNVVLYALSQDAHKVARADALMAAGGVVSVQVLNEATNVMRRKWAMAWGEVDAVLEVVSALCRIEPLTAQTHALGRNLAQRYSLSIYDAMIVAAATLAGCNVLYSEDMQHGLVIDQSLRIINPFAA